MKYHFDSLSHMKDIKSFANGLPMHKSTFLDSNQNKKRNQNFISIFYVPPFLFWSYCLCKQPPFFYQYATWIRILQHPLFQLLVLFFAVFHAMVTWYSV